MTSGSDWRKVKRTAAQRTRVRESVPGNYTISNYNMCILLMDNIHADVLRGRVRMYIIHDTTSLAGVWEGSGARDYSILQASIRRRDKKVEPATPACALKRRCCWCVRFEFVCVSAWEQQQMHESHTQCVRLTIPMKKRIIPMNYSNEKKNNNNKKLSFPLFLAPFHWRKEAGTRLFWQFAT